VLWRYDLMSDCCKTSYNGLSYNRYCVATDFFLVPVELVLISVGDDMVTADSIRMDFRLVQTSFPVLALRTMLDTTD